MRKMLGALLVLGLLLSGMHGVTAQGTDTQFAESTDVSVVWADAEGHPVAALTVTNLDDTFEDVAERYAPDHGYIHKTVAFTIENVSDGAIIVEPSHFRLLDDHGRLHGRSSAPTAGQSIETFESTIALAPGEIVERLLVFETPAHASAALLTWEPESGTSLMIALSAEVDATSAVAWGLDAPSVYTDDFGNTVSTFQVTEINPNWSDYTEYDTPEDGQTYVAVHVSMTNETDRPVVFVGRNFNLIDSNGTEHRPSYARAEDGVEPQPFRDEMQLEPGESADVMVLFELDTDVSVVVVSWEPSWSTINIVILQEAPGPVEGTPEPIGTPF